MGRHTWKWLVGMLVVLLGIPVQATVLRLEFDIVMDEVTKDCAEGGFSYFCLGQAGDVSWMTLTLDTSSRIDPSLLPRNFRKSDAYWDWVVTIGLGGEGNSFCEGGFCQGGYNYSDFWSGGYAFYEGPMSQSLIDTGKYSFSFYGVTEGLGAGESELGASPAGGSWSMSTWDNGHFHSGRLWQVPEPGGLAILTLGLVLLGWRRQQASCAGENGRHLSAC